MVGLINELKGGVGVVRGHTVIREQCVQERTEYAALLQLSSRQTVLRNRVRSSSWSSGSLAF